MKTTYQWLQEYCDVDLGPEGIAHRLSMSGLLVEEIEPAGDDTLLVAEVTSNRPDLLGIIGIAREVCALTGGALRLPPVDFTCSDEKAESATSVEVADPDLCPRYTARLVRGVKVGPSPDWLRGRLEAIGVRPVNNIVDVTNYVLFECGQPLHAFDFAKLRGGKIVVRRARDGERMISIDETECKLDASMLVIADAERAVAIAGIMGGLDTEIAPTTTDVLLESAQFHPANNRRTSRKLGLASDSSYRFERGVDPVQIEWASRRAAHLIQKVAGGTVCEGVIDTWVKPYQPRIVSLRLARMEHVLGMTVPADEARGILERLGFESMPQMARGEIVVSIPPFRASDVSREIDLIEEVVRIYGYDKIPEKATLPMCVGPVGKFERVAGLARGTLTGLGFCEALTNSFCTGAASRIVSPWTDAEALTVLNTVRRDENRLRLSLMPGLLAVRRTNAARGVAPSPLFEISCVFLPKPARTSGEPSRDDALPEQQQVLALLDDGGLLRLKGALGRLLEAAGVADQVLFEPAEIAFFRQGQAARLMLDDQLLAVIGEVNPAVAEDFDLPRAPAVAEMNFDLLVKAAEIDHIFEKLPTQPAAARDLAVIVDEAVPWSRIQKAVLDLDLPILERIEFFDIFRGKQVPKGKKSVAFSLVFRAPDRTLTSEEVEEARQACINSLASAGAELRQ